ncbi:MAG: hypothetical protein GF393_02255 [Armatimonadia bacterium]|nr:hypothetical protein [Armatimonadia bacterium]
MTPQTPEMPPRHVTNATIAPMATERVLLLVHLNLKYAGMTEEEVEALRSAPPVPEGISDSERAQLRAYDAWDARFEGHEAVAEIAAEALSLDPDCIDAYLAEWLTYIPDSLEPLRLASCAYQRAIAEINRRWPDGPDVDIWREIVNRPLVRALSAMAITNWETGELEDAIRVGKMALLVNPGDNLGMRWYLSLWHVIVEDIAAARKLLQRYRHDDAAPFTFARALVEFALKGPSRKARRLLAEAQESNSMLFHMLHSPDPADDIMPDWDRYAHGSIEEAFQWRTLAWIAWDSVPDAIDWMHAVRGDDDFMRRSEDGVTKNIIRLAAAQGVSPSEILDSMREIGVMRSDDE